MQALEDGDPEQLGGYRLLARLGEGGMGRVYLARSRGGRRVALKVIRPELAGSPDFRARFAREVASARAVGGAFTVAVLDADTEAEVPWLATEFVAAPSLTQAVREHGALPLDSLVALAAGLAEGLAAIHAAGVIHRDLKPSNVLLALDGPRVIDFGISRAMESLEATELTRTGMMVGSPGFMSPEQIEGRPVTTATDVFSLGAVLGYAATAGSPFGEGPTPALLYRVVHSEPQLEAAPGAVRGLIAACLAKDPAARPTPEQLLDRLEELGVDHEPTQTWLPADITSLVQRVQADLPSRAGSLPGLTHPGTAVPGGAAAAGFAAAGAGTGAAGTSGAEVRPTPPTLPQPSVAPTTPIPQGFGPAPAAFGQQPPVGQAPTPQPSVHPTVPTVPSGPSVQAAPGVPPRRSAGRRAGVLVTLVLLLALVGVGIWALTQKDKGSGSASGGNSPAAGSLSGGSSGSASASASGSASASSSSYTAPTAKVPDVRGEYVDTAKQDLINAGFSGDNIQIVLGCDGNARGATGVLTQSPSPGRTVATTHVFHLTAEATDCKAYMSEVGKPVATAITDLQNAGFTNVSNQPANVCGPATDPVGTVEAQDPATGPELALRAGTPITLFTQPQDCVSATPSPSPTST